MLLVNKKKVIAEIEAYVEQHGVNYVDACIEYCRVHSIDEDSLASFIKSTKTLGLHAKVMADAKILNMVKK